MSISGSTSKVWFEASILTIGPRLNLFCLRKEPGNNELTNIENDFVWRQEARQFTQGMAMGSKNR